MKILSTILKLTPVFLVAACVAPATVTTGNNLQQVYAAAEASLLEAGRMRTEVRPADAPYTYDDLVQNFIRVALYNEYRVSGGRFVEGQTATYLRRWEGPVRVGTIFGESLPDTGTRSDRIEVERYTARLAALTGLNMRMSNPENANLLVVFLNEEEQTNFAEVLSDRYPDVSPAVVDAFRDSPRNIFCAAFGFTRAGQKGVYDHALILVKTEHSPFMRKSCIHEEMAQAMGLTNDSPDARPSIFNDDEEFAFLTRHDEILLQMLYDPRLSAGMESYEVRPLLPAIARDAAR